MKPKFKKQELEDPFILFQRRLNPNKIVNRGGGSSVSCSNRLDFSKQCNSQYLAL